MSYEETCLAYFRSYFDARRAIRELRDSGIKANMEFLVRPIDDMVLLSSYKESEGKKHPYDTYDYQYRLAFNRGDDLSHRRAVKIIRSNMGYI